MNRAETIAEILAAWHLCGRPPFGGSVLVCDPDKSQPGVAYYTPGFDSKAVGSLAPRCWVWGGNKSSAHLSNARGVAWLLKTLAPSLVVIEAALASGGEFGHSMHEHAIVRGGWCWAADLAELPRVLVDPGVWQRVIVPTANSRGSGRAAQTRKDAYKAHARQLMRKARVNEDAAAALCILDFTLRALGHELPGKIFDVAP